MARISLLNASLLCMVRNLYTSLLGSFILTLMYFRTLEYVSLTIFYNLLPQIFTSNMHF